MKVQIRGRYVGGALVEPKEGRDKLNACISELDDISVKKLTDAVDAAIVEKFGKKKKVQDWVIREGDDEEFTATFGEKFINPKSNQPIPTKRVDNGTVTDIPASEIYPGCYVAAIVSVYAYNGNKEKNIKDGVSCGIQGIAFIKDGERLGGGLEDSDFAGVESTAPANGGDIFDED